MTRYSLADLAEASGVPPRTIRFYQASGLLSKPRREGRAAVYGDAHLERLELIADLRARGLKLEAIRDMVDAGSVGKAPVVALLGPDAASERWLTETPCEARRPPKFQRFIAPAKPLPIEIPATSTRCPGTK